MVQSTRDKITGSESVPILHLPKCYQTAFWKGFNDFILPPIYESTFPEIPTSISISINKAFLPKFSSVY